MSAQPLPITLAAAANFFLAIGALLYPQPGMAFFLSGGAVFMGLHAYYCRKPVWRMVAALFTTVVLVYAAIDAWGGVLGHL